MWLFRNMKKFLAFDREVEKVNMAGGKEEVMGKFRKYVKVLEKEIERIGVIEERI